MTLPWAYFDTSALAKRYFNEPGSFRARSLMRKYRCMTSVLTCVELISVLARRHAAGELSDQAFAAIERRSRSDWDRWELVTVNEPLLRRAEEVVRARGIKTLDAIHVASAILVQESSGSRISFVSADRRQLDSAAAVALPVERINGAR